MENKYNLYKKETYRYLCYEIEARDCSLNNVVQLNYYF